MKLHGIAALSASLCVACAGSGTFDPSPEGAGSVRISPQAAMERIVVGSSRRADVGAALGKAIVIDFDSGDEVWVYRWPGAEKTTRAATELVLLFDSSGRLSRMRLRPGYVG
jgi:hypothetical protein